MAHIPHTYPDHVMYEVSCDTCEKIFKDYEGDHLYESKDQLNQEIVRHGWCITFGKVEKHYCKDHHPD